LCGSDSSAVVGRLTRAELRTIWLHNLGVDPSSWIPTPSIDYQYCDVCDLRYFDDGLAGPEEMYRELEKLPWYYLENKPEFDIAIRNLAGAERILEIGAGAGAFGRLISQRAAYVGLEFNASAAEQAVASGLDVCLSEIADLFDLILLVRSLLSRAPRQSSSSLILSSISCEGVLSFCDPLVVMSVSLPLIAVPNARG
jgi:SAM-dependent methyltransferase